MGCIFFGGHAPLISDPTLLSTLPANLQNSTIALFHPAVTYSYEAFQKIFIFILGIVAFFCDIHIIKPKQKSIRSFNVFNVYWNSGSHSNHAFR
ncbi:hypothetical protein [Methanobrevibacter arboriphilus]|uniref:hypothetical protein n=1 Tax=Methanobrevibacter arboriphilus TaxID=39441 RepID=UPI0021E66016|nr:hypothetical protein [Methanobrevibacter arboriphilus]